jgi:hypothetical protein
MEQPTEIDQPLETDTDPLERACLARLAIKLAFDPWDPEPDFIVDQLSRLNQRIATATRSARSQHWQQNADRALAAAKHYIQAQSSGTPVSLDTVAKQFNTSARSISRYAQQLKTAAGASRKVEAAQ